MIILRNEDAPTAIQSVEEIKKRENRILYKDFSWYCPYSGMFLTCNGLSNRSQSSIPAPESPGPPPPESVRVSFSYEWHKTSQTSGSNMIETYFSPTKTEVQRGAVQGWCDEATVFTDPDSFLLLCSCQKWSFLLMLQVVALFPGSRSIVWLARRSERRVQPFLWPQRWP